MIVTTRLGRSLGKKYPTVGKSTQATACDTKCASSMTMTMTAWGQSWRGKRGIMMLEGEGRCLKWSWRNKQRSEAERVLPSPGWPVMMKLMGQVGDDDGDGDGDGDGDDDDDNDD